MGYEAMSEGKIEEFMKEWEQIWKDRIFQRPLSSALIGL